MSDFKTLNCGEWSEVYAFFKILSDRKLNGCDHNLQLLNNEFCHIINIQKKQQKTNKNLIYSLTGDNIEISGDTSTTVIPVAVFQKMSLYLLNCIKTNTQRTFEISQIRDFLSALGSPEIKAPNFEKEDIILTVKEPITKTNQTYGFTIKSNLGKANSTLLNASKATNFTYSVENANISPCLFALKTKKLLKQIKLAKYISMDSETFHSNLQLIDTQFPELIAKLVLYYYQGRGSSIEELVRIIEQENPFNMANKNVYRVKIGDFLLSIALGMVPNTKWDLNYTADGGMLVIREDGELASFYIFKQVLLIELKEYLITHAYLDTPSTTRHEFGKLFHEEGKTRLKLNLQIRLAA